ncbi:MAG: hypothetical protein H0V93_16715 [Euzebyales bacterium]|jgi:hypothetical protein|nr:hypothetical protein [Euzebyales bacterium]
MAIAVREPHRTADAATSRVVSRRVASPEQAAPRSPATRRPVSRRAGVDPRAATRRRPSARTRRRLAGLALLVLLAITVVPLGGGASATTDTAGGRAPAHVVLGAGETVWAAVAPHAPHGVDAATWAHRVVAHNDFDATALPPGTIVRLP